MRPLLSPRLLLVLGLAAPLFAADMAVSAAGCRSAAVRAAQREGGEVLSARAIDGGAACEVTLLVRQPDGPPRRMVVREAA